MPQSHTGRHLRPGAARLQEPADSGTRSGGAVTHACVAGGARCCGCLLPCRAAERALESGGLPQALHRCGAPVLPCACPSHATVLAEQTRECARDYRQTLCYCLERLGSGLQGAEPAVCEAGPQLTPLRCAGGWPTGKYACRDAAALALGKRHGVELFEELGRGVHGKVYRGAAPRPAVPADVCSPACNSLAPERAQSCVTRRIQPCDSRAADMQLCKRTNLQEQYLGITWRAAGTQAATMAARWP